jgi:hypothetical protein
MDDTERPPPGQYEIDEFARFGLGRFAKRFPKETRQVKLSIRGDAVEVRCLVDAEKIAKLVLDRDRQGREGVALQGADLIPKLPRCGECLPGFERIREII